MKKLLKKEIPFNGKLITKVDPALIGNNFRILTNMRYVTGDIPHVESVLGMTKINSTALSYPKVRSGVHFKKEQPQESHILVQAYNTDLSASKIYEHKTAIPGTGDFETTELYTPANSNGRWSLAPDGDVAYCNGEETCLWGGDEREISGFINYDPSGSFLYDYTVQLRNTLTDSQNIAVLNSVSNGIDANTMLLLHLDSDVTDSSPTTPHTVTNNGVTYDTTNPVFGTARGVFASAYLSIPDDADFDFTDRTWTIDAQVEVDNLTNTHILYYDSSDAERYFKIYIDTNGAIVVRLFNSPSTAWVASNAQNVGDAVIPTTANGYFYECTVAGTTDTSEPTWPTSVGATVVDNTVTWTCRQVADMTFNTADSVIAAGTNYHIEVVENSNDWYIFVDGKLKGYKSDASLLIDYSGEKWIGYDGTNYLAGKIDEYRVSDNARNTSNFESPTSAYSASTSQINIYLGAIRPIDGFKFTIGTANTSASTMSVYYWSGSSWDAVANLVDGTSSGGVSLAQTGSVTFDSTTGSAKIKYINDVVIYWYKIVIDQVSANTSITHATVSCPFQTIKDIWDGLPREIASCQIKKTSYQDVTLSVRENTYPYSATDTQNMAEFDSLATTEHFVVGFVERQTAINIRFVSGHTNTTAGTIMTVQYWNGTSWVTLSIEDGTIEGGTSFAKSGTVSWDAPSGSSEFVQSISNDALLYYYKFSFSTALSTDVQVYYINGIPAQQNLKPYKFPLHAQNRLLLCCNEKEGKNTILVSAEGTSGSFNGNDSTTIELGDNTEITGGAWLYTQIGAALYNTIVIFKKSETWAIIGNDLSNWIKYRISAVVGCVAPETIKVVDVGNIKTTEGMTHAMVIWQGADGIYLSDGRTPVLISDDIRDIFDKQSSTAINSSKIADSVGFYDKENAEYHWCYAEGSSTTLNKEKVFSLRRMAWYDIDRTDKLQYGVAVEDTSGNSYNYGFIDTGYMLRLEYGSTFNGSAITSTVQFGDIALGSIGIETVAEHHGLIGVAQSSGTITTTHFSDGESTGSSWTFDATKTEYRLIEPVYHKTKTAVFHSWKFSTSVSFEPLYFYTYYSLIREHLKDWR